MSNEAVQAEQDSGRLEATTLKKGAPEITQEKESDHVAAKENNEPEAGLNTTTTPPQELVDDFTPALPNKPSRDSLHEEIDRNPKQDETPAEAETEQNSGDLSNHDSSDVQPAATFHDKQDVPFSATRPGVVKEELPASPPPPALPLKDDEPFSNDSNDTEATEMHHQAPESSEDLPAARLDNNADTTGTEIQDIMGQFQEGAGGLDESDIMSPRLERQQSLLILPPRSSSLEHREEALSPQTTSSTAHEGIVDQSPINSSRQAPAGKADDVESIASTRAGSIFQPPPPNPDPDPVLPFDFHRFLEQLRHRTADPVARFLRSFLNEFGKKQWMVHEQVKIISDFLEFISKKMSQCDVWRTVSDAEFDNAREGMEKLVMNRLYSQTFSPAIPAAISSPRKGGKSSRSQADAASPIGPGRRGQHQEDVERDDVIAQKMRIYGWIQEEHLDIKPVGEKGRKFLGLAQQELLKINTYRAPRDKVICVLNCCKVIFGFLRNSKADQSADAFVPLLIYTVLQARPEHLVSNVQYIWRFRNQDKLGGEAGYYMSSLMGVVTFIENLDRTTLTISDEEFERHVEQAVSAIAEKNKTEEYEQKTHVVATNLPLHQIGEKSALSRPEVTPRNSTEAEQSSPRRNLSQRLNTQNASSDDDSDAMSGLLRTIQRPLHSIGRIFSDDSAPQTPPGSLRPPRTPAPDSTPRGLSPAPDLDRRTSAKSNSSRQRMEAEDAAARQASAEAAQAQRVRAKEQAIVEETLQNMFPNLDKDVIRDVVRAQEGNVGRAVDACLAMTESAA